MQHATTYLLINKSGSRCGRREAWQVSGKGAAQRDPAQPDRLGGKRQNAQPTKQQKAKGRRITSPVLLPLTEGDGR